jgi:hypothetical protein
MKDCSHCRLPVRAPGAVYPVSHEGIAFVFLICSLCHSRLSRLPHSTRFKALNRAADAVAHDPYRFAHRAFETTDQALLFAAMAGHIDTAAAVVADLLQGDSETT